MKNQLSPEDYVCSHAMTTGPRKNMSLPTASKPIQGHLRKRINKAAHRIGRHHEVVSLTEMIAQMEVARDSGATYEELEAIVKRFEAIQ